MGKKPRIFYTGQHKPLKDADFQVLSKAIGVPVEVVKKSWKRLSQPNQENVEKEQK